MNQDSEFNVLWGSAEELLIGVKEYIGKREEHADNDDALTDHLAAMDDIEAALKKITFMFLDEKDNGEDYEIIR